MGKDTTIRSSSKTKNVPLGKMRVSPVSQRELKEYRVNKLLADFDLEKLGLPVLNHRDGWFYIIDGQHRIAALTRWLGVGWEIQRIDCRVYTDLTEAEEADMFDRLNDVLAVHAFDRFNVRVTAGRYIETEVKKTVEQQGLVISRSKAAGGITAVSTLVRIYKKSDGFTLGRALRLIRDSFGDSGFEAKVIEGISLVCQRYNGAIDELAVVKKLGGMRGGVNGLVSNAYVIRKHTGHSVANCIAAATVDAINSKRGGKKLPSWWKTD